MEYIIQAMREKGYDPYQQLKGYLLENEPGYITRYKDARTQFKRLIKNKQNNNVFDKYRFTKQIAISNIMSNHSLDMGIFIFMLETCLEHENYTYERDLYADTTDDSIEKTLIARYTYSRK